MPAADPLAGLRRAVGLDPEPPDPLSGLRAAVGAYGPWEPTRSPHVQRRRRPDGSYETRATPPEEALAPEGPPEPAAPERPIPPNIASALKAAGKTAPDIGTVDVSDPKISGLARLVYGPNATEKGVARDKARVADAGFGWVVGGAERLGLVPEGTREELRTAAAEAEEAYNLAHPAGGGPRIPFTDSTVGDLARAVSEGGQTALAGVAGPQLLLGAGLGGAAARGAGALGAGRGLATLAGAAGGAAEAAGQTYLDVVDLPPEEQARQVLLGAGLGTLGGALAGRAPRAPDAPEPRLTPEAPPAATLAPPAPDAPFEAWLLRESWEPQDLTETQRGKLRQQFFRETDPAWAAQEAESAARVAAQQEERRRLLNRPEEPDLQPPARQEPAISLEPPFPTGLEEIGPPRALDAPIEAAAQARGRLRPVVRGQDRPWSPDEARPMVYFTHPGAGSEVDALDLATAYQYSSPEGVTIQANLGPDLKIVSRRAHPELRNPHAAFEDGGERVAAILDDLGADAYVTREGGVPVIAVRREALGKLRNVQQLARGEVDDWRPLAFQSAAEEADAPVLARPLDAPIEASYKVPPAPRVAVTERGTRIGFDYEIREAGDLVTSHDEALRPRLDYPQELQPRDRARAASAAQVSRIESRLDPELLGESPHASSGAPIIGPDGIVESGNARSIALKRSYRAGAEGAGRYRSWLEENAPRFGLARENVSRFREPVLVRVRRSDVDRVRFAQEANEAPQAAMSATERAAVDASRITPEMLEGLTVTESGQVNWQAHRDFLRAFAQGVSPNELGAMFDARGLLSAEGRARIQNAILAKAYGDPDAVAKLIEHADNNVRNVGAALLREAPRYARLREGAARGTLQPLDISADLAAALRKLSALRDEGMKVQDYLAQGGLFGSELTQEARALLAVFDANARSASRVGDILRRYVEIAEGLGHPEQGGLFGAKARPSRLEVLQEAVGAGEQQGLFAMAERPPSTLDAETTARPPAVRPTVAEGLFAGQEEPARAPRRPEPPAVPPRPPIPFREQPPALPGMEGPPAPRVPMSTKALENVEGRKAEFHELVEQHRPEIEAARGPVKPASRWHDREGLARDLGMTTEDFLDSPAGRTWNDDEVSLGRHYLTGMRQEVGDLAGKLTRGEIPADQVEAAKARLAELEVDTVRMMATLQGSGFSTAARVMRSGQETLDPLGLASTPRAKLQLALLKHYGAKNAEEAAKIEQRAVARLKRQAAHEARKAGRAVTQEALSAEFQQLSSEFGKLSRTPRTGLDPELVALIGKMAANRVKAGVVAVEALADEIYQVARQHVEGIRREDVKAAIVEYTLAKPKRAPADPAAARLRAREGALQARVKKLEERIAAGPQKPKQAGAAPDSPRLEELRRRAADLKAQIAKDPKEGLAARYRALLDDQTVELIAKLPADPSSPALLDFLRKMERPTFRDYRFTFWINSVLSGTKTAARNLSGNVVRLAELTAMRAPGAVIEAGVSRAQGRPAERVLRETLPATLAVFRGIPEGLKRFAFVVKEGYDPNRLVAELTEGGTDKFDQRLPVSPFLLSEKKGVRALGAAVTVPTRLLEAVDVLIETMAATSENYAWATRKAVQENASNVGARVADLVQELPDEMLEAGRAFGRKATYKDPMSWVGSAAAAIRRGVPGARELAANLRSRGGAGNRATAALVQGPETIGQHLLPFIHISDRVAAGLTDYIPGAKPFKLAKLLAEKSPEASDLIARQVVGGALTMLGIGWAARGKLTGAAPKDEKLKNDFYAEGKQPYSLLVGGRWVPIRDTLGPLAGPFVAAAMYNDHVRVGEDPSAALTGMALGSSRYLLDASYMATLQQVIEAVDAEQGDVGRGLNQAGARVVGGYVPYSGLLRNVAQARDPRVVDKEGFLDELKAGIPGLREQLPARLDTDEDPLVMTTGAAGGVSPVVPTEAKAADPALAEKVERLRYTLTTRRTELRQLEERLANARTLKDATRAREILQQLPRGMTAADLDGTMKEIRALEQEIRELRKSKAPEERRKAVEIKKQQRMAQILEQALGRLGGGE